MKRLSVKSVVFLSNLKAQISSVGLFLLCVIQVPIAYASSPSIPSAPTAGALQQQIDRARELNSQKPAPFIEEKPASASPKSGGPTITVKAFEFVGNTVYTNDELNKLLASYLGHPIEFKELEDAALRVAEFYRQDGWVVKTTLPTQGIIDGVVRIRIIEAVMGQVRIDGAGSSRVSNKKIIATMYGAQRPGALLNSRAIERGVSLVGDLAGVRAEGSFAEGEREGETDFVLKLVDRSLIFGEVGSDNSGSRSTGINRLTSTLNVNSPLGTGDQLSTNLISSLGSDYLRVAESLPVGDTGLKMGISASYLSYRLITQDFAALSANGTSSILGFETNYPALKSNSSLLSLGLNVDHKHYVNHSQGALVSDYTNNPVTLTTSGFKSDQLAGSYSVINLSISSGSINLDHSPAQYQASDSSTTQVAGQYSKARYFASREQGLMAGFSLFGSVAGQWSTRNLDSSEKFYLGGLSGVRAYPSNEAGGSLGELLSIELRDRLSSSLNTAAFYDFGRVLINPNNSYTGASLLNDYSLKGAGVSVTYEMRGGANFKAVVAHRIGQNPNPTTTGNDQDGSLVKNRIWLSANLPF